MMGRLNRRSGEEEWRGCERLWVEMTRVVGCVVRL